MVYCHKGAGTSLYHSSVHLYTELSGTCWARLAPIQRPAVVAGFQHVCAIKSALQARSLSKHHPQAVSGSKLCQVHVFRMRMLLAA
jgi:hypothetical protein